MIVDSMNISEVGNLARISVQVQFEDVPNGTAEVGFIFDPLDSDVITPNIDALRIPLTIAAMEWGERRIAGPEPICPALNQGLQVATTWLSRWSHTGAGAPKIDFPMGCTHPDHTAVLPPAALISGGVDSLGMLAANHASYPVDHPRRFGIGLAIVGIQRHRWPADGMKDRLQEARSQLSAVGKKSALRMVPIITDLRTIVTKTIPWQYRYQGAVLAGASHLLAGVTSHASIASTWQIRSLEAWGSHPLIDPEYSTHSFQIHHEQSHLTRLDKLRILAHQSNLLDEINVCNAIQEEGRNCGRCEKCLRTMLGLVALDELATCDAFAASQVRVEDLESVRVRSLGLEGEYNELAKALRAAGHDSLGRRAAAIANQHARRRYIRGLYHASGMDKVGEIIGRFDRPG